MRCINRILIVSALGAVAASSFAQKPGSDPGYLPIDSSVSRAGVGAVGIWDLSAISQTELDRITQGPPRTQGGQTVKTVRLTTHEFCFDYYSLDAAVKLGINYLSISGDRDYSVLFAENRRFESLAVDLFFNGSTTAFPATALVGSSCRVNMLARQDALDVNLAQGASGLSVKIKAVQESLSFSAVGFTFYSPFEISIQNDGTVDLIQLRKTMAGVFNDYMAAAGDIQANIVPRILGFKVNPKAPNFPDISKVTKVVVKLRS